MDPRRRPLRPVDSLRAAALPAVLGLAVVTVGGAALCFHSTPRVSGPLACETAVQDSSLVGAAGGTARGGAGDIILGALLTRVYGRVRVSLAQPDYPALQARERPIGLLLRVAPGPESPTEVRETTAALASHTIAFIAEARAWGVEVAEVLVDIAGPEHDLDAWGPRLAALRRATAPRPVRPVVTPEWIGRGDLYRLAGAAGGWVLKIPAPDGGAGSEPGSIRVLVERAARLGLPFRVALATPPDAPDAAILLRLWSTDRPLALAGIVWHL
jgi:hypothetical protein